MDASSRIELTYGYGPAVGQIRELEECWRPSSNKLIHLQTKLIYQASEEKILKTGEKIIVRVRLVHTHNFVQTTLNASGCD